MTSVYHSPGCPVSIPGFILSVDPRVPSACRCDFGMRLAAALGKYEPFPCPCCLSETSLMDAGLRLGPSFEYELHVHPMYGPWARQLVRTLGAATVRHPFAPAINVREDESISALEWFVSANGKSVGSEGV